MKTLLSDLFPETLLVDVADGHAYTTSRKVAEHFKKRHDNVMRDIANLDCSEAFSLLNFEERNYQYLTAKNQKREAPEYRMTRDGFMFLIGGMPGKIAGQWKEDFIAAFNFMEVQLRAHQDRYVAAFKQKHSILSIVVEATLQGKSRAEIAALTGRSPGSATYHRRVGRDLSMLPSLTKKATSPQPD